MALPQQSQSKYTPQQQASQQQQCTQPAHGQEELETMDRQQHEQEFEFEDLHEDGDYPSQGSSSAEESEGEEGGEQGQQGECRSKQCSSRAERQQQRAQQQQSASSQDGDSFPMDDYDASSRSTVTMHSPLQEFQAQAHGKRSQPRAMAASLPVRSSAVKMGSSVPVNIPMGAAMRARGIGTQGEPQEASATFIPPHQFSQRDGFTMGSFVPGETPGMAIKRDRLRVRNAILRSTGFLENNAAPLPHTGSLSDRPQSQKGLGGLSQAIKAVGSPAS